MNEPYASIPIEWGLKPSPYHNFLIWLACRMSGSDGFNGLQAGEVRFSRRELELHLKTGNSSARNLVQKAIKEGLLIPTGTFGRKHGEGEIYQTGGDLLGSRSVKKTGNPRSDQDRTKIGPTNQLKQDGLGVSTTKEQPKVNPRSTRLKEETQKKQKNKTQLTDVEFCKIKGVEEYLSLRELWPSGRNQKPMAAVLALANIKASGKPIAPIVDKAAQLIKETNGYVTRLDLWLEGGSWDVAEKPAVVYQALPYALPTV